MFFMTFEVIDNASFYQPAGFTKGQFRKLDQLYSSSASEKIITYRTVDCDFDEGLATYTYYLSGHHTPYLQFVIRKVGPRTTMFELYKHGRGRVVKSSVFDRVFDRLREEVESLSAS